MPKQYMTRNYPQTGSGQRHMQRDINELASEGWVVASTQVSSEGYAAGKTCCLGCLFLPLALLGRKPNSIQVMFERETA